MSDLLVSCEDVGKIYCRDLRHSLWYGVVDIGSDLLARDSGWKSGEPCQRELRKSEFWANREISFEVHRGECLGIIGRNGAGKTTLLKMLNGLIKPDTGRITMRGTVGALIALGAGFNPLLTGRENITINASILGMSRRQISQIIDDVIDFAELSEFIDAPVRTYSSGMAVRLGFSIATCLRPDVLIVDEVLAVGDADFRLKCVDRIRNVMSNGSAVLLVSHRMNDVSNLASSALWLEKGQPRQIGNPFEVITQYLGTSSTSESSIVWDDDNAPGCGTAVLRELSVRPPDGSSRISIASGATVNFRLECRRPNLSLDFTLEVRTEEDIVVMHTGGVLTPDRNSLAGEYSVDITLPEFLLNSGKYQLSVIIGESQSVQLIKARNAVAFQVHNDARGVNHNQVPGIVAPRLQWTVESPQANESR